MGRVGVFLFFAKISETKCKVSAYRQCTGSPSMDIGAVDLCRDRVFHESLSVVVVRGKSQTHHNIPE